MADAPFLPNAPENATKPSVPVTSTRSSRPSGAWTSDWWILEFLSALLGAALLIALCVILKKYDGQKVPQWGSVLGSNITLNTVVSILSTIAKAALLVPVGEAISQLKWNWYANSYRPLGDLETFDKASRGAMGSAALLFKVHVRQFASIGALIMIIAIAIDPLSQQSVLIYSKPVPSDSGTASVSKAEHWMESTGSSDVQSQANADGYTAISMSMKGYIQTGLFSGNTSIDDIAPICSSGNCTWPPYRSLAVCSRTANVSSHLTKKQFSTEDAERFNMKAARYSLTEDHYLENNGDLFTMNVTSVAPPKSSYDYADTGQPAPLSFNQSIAFKDIQSPIADVFLIYLDKPTTPNGELNVYSAVEFVLEWCVQTFETSFTDGVPHTTRLGAYRNFSGPESSSTTAWPDGIDGPIFYVDGDTHYSMQRYFQALLNGTVAWILGTGSLITTSDAAQAVFQPFSYQSTEVGAGTYMSGLNALLENIATSMTNQIRSRTTYPLTPPVNGVVYQQEAHIRIRWGYIAAPVAFGGLSLLFFIITLTYQRVSTTKTQAWKSSSLAVLHGLSPQLQDEFGGLGKPSALNDQGSRTKVRLERQDGEGWRLYAKPKSLIQ